MSWEIIGITPVTAGIGGWSSVIKYMANLLLSIFPGNGFQESGKSYNQYRVKHGKTTKTDLLIPIFIIFADFFPIHLRVPGRQILDRCRDISKVYGSVLGPGWNKDSTTLIDHVLFPAQP